MDKEEKKKKEKIHDEEVQDLEKDQHEDEHQCRCEEFEAKYKRALADYQNLEKRNREERGEWIRTSGREILLRLLPVLDTLSLANKHVEDQGIKVTLQQFQDVLKAEGVLKIETLGKKFDPHLMEAVEMVEDGDDVVEEVREGYMLHDRLLRPAHVRVGKKK
ncbi:MAG: hypothetical protein RLZZ455_467 [Candidatus Parcubacteria bacterium]|jgi:molecular chaperone GrpE